MDKFELVRFTDNDFELDVRADSENETVWLTQDEMALLFDVDRTRITRHINNIYKDQELDKESTSAENAHMGSLGVQHYYSKLYNLDMIISVGYRVKTKNGVIFRQWANSVLKDYLIKGYAINERRLIALNKKTSVHFLHISHNKANPDEMEMITKVFSHMLIK